jgi:hypothetical protein
MGDSSYKVLPLHLLSEKGLLNSDKITFLLLRKCALNSSTIASIVGNASKIDKGLITILCKS